MNKKAGFSIENMGLAFLALLFAALFLFPSVSKIMGIGGSLNSQAGVKDDAEICTDSGKTYNRMMDELLVSLEQEDYLDESDKIVGRYKQIGECFPFNKVSIEKKYYFLRFIRAYDDVNFPKKTEKMPETKYSQPVCSIVKPTALSKEDKELFVTLLEEFLLWYPEDSNLDEIRFRLGRVLFEEKKEESLKYFKQITKETEWSDYSFCFSKDLEEIPFSKYEEEFFAAFYALAGGGENGKNSENLIELYKDMKNKYPTKKINYDQSGVDWEYAVLKDLIDYLFYNRVSVNSKIDEKISEENNALLIEVGEEFISKFPDDKLDVFGVKLHLSDAYKANKPRKSIALLWEVLDDAGYENFADYREIIVPAINMLIELEDFAVEKLLIRLKEDLKPPISYDENWDKAIIKS